MFQLVEKMITITNPLEEITFADYNKKNFLEQIDTFDCGDAIINKFLKEAARHVCTTKLVFVNNKLAAFVSYNCSSFEEIKYQDGYTITENVPAIEIKVYAVALSFQHDNCCIAIEKDKYENFSHFIFSYFLVLLGEIANKYIAASYFIVFSKKEKSSFLAKQGFQVMVENFQAHINQFEENCTPMFAKIPNN